MRFFEIFVEVLKNGRRTLRLTMDGRSLSSFDGKQILFENFNPQKMLITLFYY